MIIEPERPDFWFLDFTPTPEENGGVVTCPLHYGETAELLLSRGVKGDVTVNGHKFVLRPETAVFIPPKQLHTAVYRSGGNREGDMIRAFHVNLKNLEPYVDVKRLFSIDTIPAVQEDFERLYSTVLEILDETASFPKRIRGLICLFEILSRPCGSEASLPVYNHHAIRIAEWAEENYHKKVTVQDAAEAFGYNKYYFCKWIRCNAGTSFSELLNAVRVNHAVTHLLNGCSIEEASEQCGFSDTSYFIKVFKKITGYTPKSYQNRFLKKQSGI